jgi:hypothetical protein
MQPQDPKRVYDRNRFVNMTIDQLPALMHEESFPMKNSHCSTDAGSGSMRFPCSGINSKQKKPVILSRFLSPLSHARQLLYLRTNYRCIQFNK